MQVDEVRGLVIDGFLEFHLGGGLGGKIADASCREIILCERVY